MNLDDDLRRLFTDARLDVAVHPGATESVVTGARRRRARRVAGITAAGSLAVALAVGGVALAGGATTSAPIGPAQPGTTELVVPHPTTTLPTTRPTTTITTRPTTTITTRPTTTLAGTVTATTEPVTPTGPVLGPHGFGALRLGMGYKAAVATGVLVPDVPPSAERGCEGYDLVGYPNEESQISVYAMHELGIAAIFLQEGMSTPEGIRLGSPLADFEAAYGAVPPGQWQAVVAVPGNPDAIYHMVVSANGDVGSLALALRGHTCFG